MRVIALLLLLAAGLDAQIAPRPLGATVATFPLNAWGSAIHELPNGDVLVVDSLKRLVLLDSALRFKRVVVDSIPSRLRESRPSTGILIPRPDGSSFYIDGVRNEFAIIDSLGAEVSESHPLPRPDAGYFRWLYGGQVGMDPGGRLIYARYPSGGPPIFYVQGETALIIAVDPFEAVSGDPRATPAKGLTSVLEQRPTIDGALRPIVNNDAWAVLPEGIVVLRANENSVELWGFDGRRVASKALNVSRRPVSLADKAHIVDSTLARARDYYAKHPDDGVILNVQQAGDLPSERSSFWPNSLIAGPDDTAWFVESRAYGPSDSTVVDALSARNGITLSVDRILVPPGMRILGFGRGAIYLWRPFGPLLKVRR